MAFIYFYIFYIFHICIHILLIYLRDILSFAWPSGYATRPVVLLILCIQIVLLRIIIISITQLFNVKFLIANFQYLADAGRHES